MKQCLGILFLSLLLSCHSVSDDGVIGIDLNDAGDRINYSSFVDSLSYITLHMDEDTHIGEVNRIYKRGDFFYVWGTHGSGILVFDSAGKLYSNIKAYGEGPEDFRDISCFSVVSATGDVCIMDYASQKLKYYGMDGSFKFSTPCPHWSVDIVSLDMNRTIFVSPFYLGENNAKGIWLSDGADADIRRLSDNVTSEHRFFYFPMTYNMGDTCFYYYDRNWNSFSSVSEEGLQLIHQFDVKQKIPSSLMGDTNGVPSRLNGYTVCDRFAYSPSRLLLSYCQFDYANNGDNRSYVWALVDNSTGHVELARELYNDLDSVRIDTHSLYYIDEMTWARVCDEDAESFDIRLQLLHL